MGLTLLLQNGIFGFSEQVTKYDENRDGVSEDIAVDIKLFEDPETTNAISILFFFDFGLSDIVKMEMQDFIQVEIKSSSGISSAKVFGDLYLKQKTPIKSR